jgi:hypothetical protein
MVSLLSEIAARTPDEHPFLGDKVLRELEPKLAALPAGAGPQVRWDLEKKIGVEKLRLGRNEEAVKHLETAFGYLPAILKEIGNEEARGTVFHLALANLRMGETQNCVARHTAESCILPLQGSAVHVDQRGSRRAIDLLQRILSVDPNHVTSRWLLNIAYMTIGAWPDGVPPKHLVPPSAFASDEEFPRFTNVSANLGLDRNNLSGGTIIDDLDGDHDLDVLISSFHTAGPLVLYRNEGDARFVDRTVEAGLEGLLGGLNMVQADYDNDGDVDLYVIRGAWLGAVGRHPDSLVRNNGDGTFTDVTFQAGLGRADWPSQTACWGDYDNDGDLDLFVGNETGPTLRSPCELFRNEGNGTFTEVAAEAGVENYRFTKGAVWGDYDGDRLPDLYVSNLGEENRLYKNEGNGKFVDVAPRLGVTHPVRSFPTWFWDFNNDGALDIFVSSYWPPVYHTAASYMGLPHGAELARLYVGDGRGGFRDAAVEMGIRRVMLPMGSNHGDLDNDGWLDFYLGTGYPGYEGLVPNVMFRNRGGKGFADVTTAGGFGHLQKGHAVAFADLDEDGDQDVFEQMGGAFAGDSFRNILFENPGFGNHWLKVKLIGKRSNRSAIGARLRAEIDEGGTRRSIYSHVNSGGSFGANPLRRHIGLGKADRVERLEVFWPTTGVTQVLEAILADQSIEITEDEASWRAISIARSSFH